MYNWSTNTTKLKKSTKEYAVWKLEQLINYGLDGEKLDAKLLEKYWETLHIDNKKRLTLAYLLWQKQS